MSDDRLSQLSPSKRALLLQELSRRREQLAAPTQTISPRPAGSPPALSRAQRRLWFLDQMSPGGSTYNATLTMRLDGALDVDALHWALDRIVERHEALRTVCVDSHGHPTGALLDAGVQWLHVDLSATERAAEELDRRLAADARKPFDLSSEVMLRASLYTVGADHHVLILTLHHISSDGWSRGILFDELAAGYNARVAGVPLLLPPLAVQYGDYAVWEEQMWRTGRKTDDVEFWRDQLEGTDFVLDLPISEPRSARPTYSGSRVGLLGEAASGDALRGVARGEGATFFMALMAVTGVFLHGLTGQEDFLLGSPMANRQLPELEKLIGFFVNTVVLRVQMTGNPSFTELLRRCREASIASLAHQDTSFDSLVEAINPKRHPGRNPLFQVNYRMQGVAPPTPALTGIRSSRMVTATGSARFDLAVGFTDGPGALRGYIEYNEALFDSASVARWTEAIPDLVEMVVAEPSQRLSQLAGIVGRAHRSGAEHRPSGPTASTGRRIRRTGLTGSA